MAVVQTGPLIADARGSVGDVVFTRTQGGITVRSRITPTNPDTAPQQAVRDTLKAVAAAWSADLTEAQRTAWSSYAHAYPRPNRWGAKTLTNGYTQFIRHNVYRYRETSAIQFPSAPATPPLHIPMFSFRASRLGSILVTGTPTPDCTGLYNPWIVSRDHTSWRREDGAYFIWFYVGTAWLLSQTLGVSTPNRWVSDTGLLGSWRPLGTATGTPTSILDDEIPVADVDLPPTNYDPLPDNALRLYAYAGRPSAPGALYFNGPWTLAAAQTHDGTWGQLPWRFAYPWPVHVGELCRLRTVAQDLDTGSLSTAGFAQAEEQPLDD